MLPYLTHRRNYKYSLAILCVMLFILWFLKKFNYLEDSPTVSETYLNVEVISARKSDNASFKQVARNTTFVTVQLPDGKRAVLPYQHSQPAVGEHVKVKVTHFEDGKQRVTANEIWR